MARDGISTPESGVARGVLALRERILSGELAPGQPLQEVRLAAQLGMSRNTLRAALLSLASEGIVQHEPNRGASVVQLGVEDARDIYRVRRLVEVAASGNAASTPLAARHELSGLEHAAQLGSLDRLVHADLVFHRRLASRDFRHRGSAPRDGFLSRSRSRGASLSV